MKKLVLFIAAIITAVTMAVPAHAGFRIGPRVGVDVSSLHFNTDMFNKDNCVGFTGGLQAEVTLPLGICFDGSIMYVRRSLSATANGTDIQAIEKSRDYINVPINFKWKIGLPLVGKIISPYVFTGPDFAFLASKSGINDAWKSHKVDVAWNFGVGVELIRHLQIGASYGMGITKLSHILGGTSSKVDQIEGKNNNWTVTAAWLF